MSKAAQKKIVEAKPYSLDVVAPVFRVKDLQATLEFLRDKLEFTVGFAWSESDDEPASYAILQQDNCEIHLSQTDDPRPAVVYIFMSNVEAFYNTAKENGAEVGALEVQPWGMREFEVSDPDGNRIIFGEQSDE